MRTPDGARPDNDPAQPSDEDVPGGSGEPPEADSAHRLEAEQAHGGSVAPGWVDATGKQIADPPPPADE